MIVSDLSAAGLQQASVHLASIDADWARHVATIGPCLHRATPGREPYEALVRAIAYQQLHARAGDAIEGESASLEQWLAELGFQLLLPGSVEVVPGLYWGGSFEKLKRIE